MCPQSLEFTKIFFSTYLPGKPESTSNQKCTFSSHHHFTSCPYTLRFFEWNLSERIVSRSSKDTISFTYTLLMSQYFSLITLVFDFLVYHSPMTSVDEGFRSSSRPYLHPSFLVHLRCHLTK